MRVTEAKYENGWLCLKTEPKAAMQWLISYKPKDYKIVEERKKRSLNANAYAWALIGQLAARMDIPPEEVYTHEIAEIGGKTTVISIQHYAAEEFARTFRAGHLGRKVQLIGEHSGIMDLLLTYGSSDYDSKQMSQLIDTLVQDCKLLGIETLDEANIKSLIEEWGKTHDV